MVQPRSGIPSYRPRPVLTGPSEANPLTNIHKSVGIRISTVWMICKAATHDALRFGLNRTNIGWNRSYGNDQ